MKTIRNDKPVFDAFRTLTGPISPSEFDLVKGSVEAFNSSGSDEQIFAVFRTMDADGRISQREFDQVKAAIAAGVANDDEVEIVRSGGRDMSDKAIDSLKKTEGFHLKAYPDPGSRDGHPWTIGYGATGPGISRGVVWTKAQADARLVKDVRRFEDGVEKVLGSAGTNQQQFDAIAHFAYNIGIGALSRSTFLRKHKAGDYAGAEREFARWNKNDGRVMRGLVNRRKIEAAMYAGRHY